MRILFLFFIFISLQATQNTYIDELKFKYSFDIGGEPSLAILQDSQDFIWFGSFFSGIVRFDGINVKKIRASKSTITDNFVTQIFEDSDKLLWIGTANGLTSYNKKTNTYTQYFSKNIKNTTTIIGNSFAFSSPTIAQDKDKNIWFGTQSGISVLHYKTKLFKHFQHDKNDINSLSSNEIYAITIDSNDHIWIGTKNGGLNLYNKNNDNFKRYIHNENNSSSIPANDIQSIIESNDGDLWLSSKQKGLIYFNTTDEKFKLYNVKDGLPKMEIWDIKFIKNNLIAISSSIEPVGLVLFDTVNKKFLQHKVKPNNLHTLSSNSLHTFLVDNTGTLWVTHNSGKVDKYDSKILNFNLYKHDQNNKNSLSSNTPIPIYEDKLNNIWIGHFGAGLDLFDKETNTFEQFKHKENDITTLPHGYPSGFFEDNEGNFIVSTAKGMVIFDRDKKKVVKTISTDTWFYTIIADNENPNIIWANGWESSFNRFNLKTGEKKQYKYSVNDKNSFAASNSVRFIQDKNDKNIFWIATWGGGLDKFNKKTEKFTHHQHDENNNKSIASNSVFDVYEDSRGIFWVCTDKGLSIFEKKTATFSHVKLEDAKTIHNVQEDNQQNLWFATDIGLVKFDGVKRKVIKVYTSSDGLHSHNFFATARGKTTDGQLWYGGFNGLNSFYPHKLKENTKTPRIFLTSLKQNNKDIVTTKGLTHIKELNLEANNNTFEFSYVALNYTNSKKNQYKYILEGYDSKWYDSKYIHKGRYSNLPSGEYTLRIKGSNNDLYWSTPDQNVVLKVIVATPWWKTNSAYIIYMIFILILIYLLYRWKVNQNRAKDQLIFQQNKLTSMGEMIENIAHQWRQPLSQINSAVLLVDDEVYKHNINSTLMQNKLDEIESMTAYMSKTIDDFKTFYQDDKIKRAFSIGDSVDLSISILKEALKYNKIEIVKNIDNNIKIFNYKNEFEQAILVILNNAKDMLITQNIKDPKITINLEVTKTSYRLKICDNGGGIAENIIDKIFDPYFTTKHKSQGTGLGLYLCKIILEKNMNGTFYVKNIHHGACFYIVFAKS